LPLYLDSDLYVNVPFDTTYMTAFGTVLPRFRSKLGAN